MLSIKIRKELFWDVSYENLTLEKHRHLIIERVLNFGTIEEFKAIMQYYGFDQIRATTKNIGYFDPKTLEFVTSFFKIDKKDLKCYTKKQLQGSHWN